MDANLFQQRRGGGNAKAVGILSGFLQLSQAGVADLGPGGMHRVTNALQENWSIRVEEVGPWPWEEGWVPKS